MKLRHVYPQNFAYVCKKCKMPYRSYEKPAYADLDGNVFQDYYCELCVNVMPGISDKEWIKIQK